MSFIDFVFVILLLLLLFLWVGMGGGVRGMGGCGWVDGEGCLEGWAVGGREVRL